MKIQVLAATRYDFKDDDNRTVQGCKVTYKGDLFDPSERDKKGVQILTVSAPYSVFEALPAALPADVDAEFSQKMSGKNVTLTLKSVRVLAPAK